MIYLKGYVFDIDFREMRDGDEDGNDEYVAIFRLFSHDDKPDLYLRLENHHNGYYSHGFTFKTDKIVKGSL